MSRSSTSWSPDSHTAPACSTPDVAPGCPSPGGCSARVRAPSGSTSRSHSCTSRTTSSRRRRKSEDDLAQLPFADASFDAVVSFYAIIHVPRVDHPTVFAEVRRVLRPGGLALLCVGAADLPEDYDPESWLGAPMYWSHYDAATNRELIGAAGLEIVEDRTIPDPMGHSGHLFVLARRLVGGPERTSALSS